MRKRICSWVGYRAPPGGFNNPSDTRDRPGERFCPSRFRLVGAYSSERTGGPVSTLPAPDWRLLKTRLFSRRMAWWIEQSLARCQRNPLLASPGERSCGQTNRERRRCRRHACLSSEGRASARPDMQKHVPPLTDETPYNPERKTVQATRLPLQSRKCV